VAGALLLLAATFAGGFGAQPAGSLAAMIERLASERGFEVRGIERIGTEAAPETADGDLLARLSALLAGYNHVVEGTAGTVTRVIVLGPRTAAPPPQRAVRTTRRGDHHLVEAVVQGPAAAPLTLSLMLDTGASSIVLPERLLGPLGFEERDLAVQRSQTANGQIVGRAGRLSRVRVGAATAEDVAVLFVPDEQLGGVMLLGMSFLGNFAFSVDNRADQLMLTPR
jgi:aspartyl protease family protein